MQKILLFDGSFSQGLKEFGFDCENEPLWTAGVTIKDPTKAGSVYKRFLQCGVDIISTNTYHASIPLIKKSYPDDPDYLEKLIKEPIISLQRVIRESASSERRQTVRVMGSIGCYGVSLRDCSEYHGKYVDEPGIEEKMVSYHSAQLNEFLKNDLNSIIFETIPALLEVKCILKAIDELPVEVVISLTCKDGEHLRHGEPISDAAVLILSHPKVVGIGINCTDSQYISSLLKRLPSTEELIFVYPNSGFESTTTMTQTSTSGNLENLLREWTSLGANVFGCCCGCATEVINEMRSIVDRFNQENKDD